MDSIGQLFPSYMDGQADNWVSGIATLVRHTARSALNEVPSRRSPHISKWRFSHLDTVQHNDIQIAINNLTQEYCKTWYVYAGIQFTPQNFWIGVATVIHSHHCTRKFEIRLCHWNQYHGQALIHDVCKQCLPSGDISYGVFHFNLTYVQLHYINYRHLSFATACSSDFYVSGHEQRIKHINKFSNMVTII